LQKAVMEGKVTYTLWKKVAILQPGRKIPSVVQEWTNESTHTSLLVSQQEGRMQKGSIVVKTTALQQSRPVPARLSLNRTCTVDHPISV
jgi:hypothetical protein